MPCGTVRCGEVRRDPGRARSKVEVYGIPLAGGEGWVEGFYNRYVDFPEPDSG